MYQIRVKVGQVKVEKDYLRNNFVSLFEQVLTVFATLNFEL